jgi:hypothetical protein
MKKWLELNLQLRKEDLEKPIKKQRLFQHGLLYVQTGKLELIPNEEETGEQEK